MGVKIAEIWKNLEKPYLFRLIKLKKETGILQLTF